MIFLGEMCKWAFLSSECFLHCSNFELFYFVGENLVMSFFLSISLTMKSGNQNEMRFRGFRKKEAKKKNMML